MQKIVFFGSFQHYSVYVLDALVKSKEVEVVGVVTTPPKPAGRKKELKKTDVQTYAEEHNIPIFTPENLKKDPSSFILHLSSLTPDLFLTAGYGKLLPSSWLKYPKYGSLNLHFSLLPKYRGANPAEWAILRGETETGITLIEMSEKFDQGSIVAQARIPIEENDTRETIYEKLYQLGGKKLPNWLNQCILHPAFCILHSKPQPKTSPTPYAKRLNKDDGFVAWQAFLDAAQGEETKITYFSKTLREILNQNEERKNQNFLVSYLFLSGFLEKASRALSGFPSLWTIVPTSKGEKRMKILKCHIENKKLILDKVQIEGQNEANWNQVKNSISSAQ